MDRPTTRTEADARGSRLAHGEAFLLPSRKLALEICRQSFGAGPVLLTGDAGIGKTWLWRRLEAEANSGSRWLGVDLTPANDPDDFYRLIGHGLGLDAPGVSRVDLADYLVDRHADGDRRALVVEEAHNLSTAVWEEVRVLANRLGRPDGFAALLLVGQTALARRFSTRPFASIEARLAARVHLGPIDADEARELVTRLRPGRTWSAEEVEAIHRDSAGNPRRLLRRLDLAASAPIDRPTLRADAPEPVAVAPVVSATPGPLTGPGKPPLRVEENLIEVGWSPEDVPESDDESEASSLAVRALAPSRIGEEAIHDHYAALQAWSEWTLNQERRGQPTDGPAATREPVEEGAEDVSPLADHPTVWADGEQRFAPFGQLFTRMAEVRDSE